MPTKTLTLHLVRHGETYFNRYNKLQGWSNSPLTPRGLAQAVEVGTQLTYTHYAAAYSSDTTRAEQTARIILSHNAAGAPAQPRTSPRLRENFFGSFEGTDAAWAWFQAGGPHGLTSLTEIISAHSLATARDWLKEADPFHEAENDDEYWERIHRGYADILTHPGLADGDTVLVVSHATTLRSLAERYGAGRFDATTKPKNGGLTTVRLQGDVSEAALAPVPVPALDVVPALDFLNAVDVVDASGDHASSPGFPGARTAASTDPLVDTNLTIELVEYNR